MISRAEVEAALYTDESGEQVGLDEVQLLEPIAERIPRLRAIARGDEPSFALEAALVLAAWGDEVGLSELERFVDTRGHERGPWMPHRIYGYDDVYDHIADAVALYGLEGGSADAQQRLYEKLLSLYGPCQMTTRLKDALLKWQGPPLLTACLDAFARARAHGHVYLASQLLPVIARWSEEAFWQSARQLEGERSHPDPRYNLVEALAQLRSEQARAALERLSGDPDVAIAGMARRMLAAQS